MLRPIQIPGLFVTATDTEVGKTVIAAAIGNWFRRRGFRVGVCKPVATGCKHVREGLVSEDAELLAHCANAAAPLDVICPQRFSLALAPAVAARREGRPMDWEAIQQALNEIAAQSDVMIVEGVGGVMVPMDEKFL
ncbi:MAG TPA: dethiobiotin synthase, partial [Humisphaera sp.]|nr:dethiobiotin synthase [Humisphaera sp.]